MKSIGETHEKGDPGLKFGQSDQEKRHQQRRVKREKIRGQGYEKIGLGKRDLAAEGGNLKGFYAAPEHKGPKRMGQLMSHDVDENRFPENQMHDGIYAHARDEGQLDQISELKVQQMPGQGRGAEHARDQQEHSRQQLENRSFFF